MTMPQATAHDTANAAHHEKTANCLAHAAAEHKLASKSFSTGDHKMAEAHIKNAEKFLSEVQGYGRRDAA